MSEEWIPPDGYHYEWRSDLDWKIGGDDRKCRMKGCAKPAVAALKRRRRNGPFGYSWWHYCVNHLYGRRIKNGEVQVRILVKNEEATA